MGPATHPIPDVRLFDTASPKVMLMGVAEAQPRRSNRPQLREAPLLMASEKAQMVDRVVGQIAWRSPAKGVVP